MLRHLFYRRIFEQKICFDQYHLRIHFLKRFLNIRYILIGLFLLFLVFVLRIWGDKKSFGQYNYVFGRETILEESSSRFHNITVAESGSLRMLRFDKLRIGGVIHLGDPTIILFDYMRVQLLCLLWNPEPERILIIGIGVGLLPKIFHYLSPNTLIDIVEKDSVVVDLVRKHFYFSPNNFIRVHIEDGRHFLERQPSNQYDVIIIDVFSVNGHVPHLLRTLECLGEYLRTLKSTGLVVGNFLYEEESRYRETYAHALFKHIYRGITKENYLLIGLNQQAKIFNQYELQLRARSLQQIKSLSEINWIEEIQHIRHGNEDKWNSSAPVFTDKKL